MDMRFLILTIFLLPTFCFAGLNEIRVTNLSGDYLAPNGSGTFEKFSVDLSFLPPKYSFEISHTERGYLLSTPMADIHWTKPPKFIHKSDGLIVRGLNLKLGKGEHEAQAPYLSYTAHGAGAVGLDHPHLRCKGGSKNTDFLYEVLGDCLNEMIFTSEKVHVPDDFFLLDFFRKIYGTRSLPESNLDNFLLTSREGDFYLYFLTRYYVKAGLRTWGKVSFDEKEEVLTLKINLIKFGIFPVTSMVMDEIKKKFEGPDVIVEPPYIKIKLKQNEARTH